MPFPRALCLLALLPLLASGCTRTEAAHPQAAAAPPPVVSVLTVQPQDVPIYGEWVGTLNGVINADIKAQVSGYVLRQDYHDGDFVHRGQLLFELDPRPFEAVVSQAQAQVAQAKGQLAQARSQELQAQAGLTQTHSQLLQAQAVVSQAHSQRLQALAGLAQAQANQGRAQLDVDKYQPLVAQKAVTQQDLDNSVQSNLAAKAQVAAARAQIGNAQATIAGAEAQVGNAQAAIVGAQAQISTAHSAVVSAQAQVQAAEAQVRTATLNLGFTRLASPIDGVAGLARTQVGDLVGPTSEALTTVSKVNPIKAEFTIPEQEYIDSAKRHVDQRHTSFELLAADGTVYPHRGRFFAEDRNVANGTGAIRVVATFPNPSRTLRPGQYARVRAVRYVKQHVLMIPQRAVSELLDRYQVAVVGADGKVDLRSVQAAERVGSQWVIDSGLRPGDRVVVEGTMKLGPGMAVSPVPYASLSPSEPGTP